MKRSNFVLLIAAVLAIALLAGCATPTTAPTTGTTGTGATTAAPTTEKPRERVTVTMQLVSPRANQEELDKIAAEISKITEEKFNTSYELTYIAPQDVATQLNLVLATGSDELDIFQSFNQFNQFVARGYLLDINGMEEYYQDALNVLGDTDRIAVVDGKRYGLPFMNAAGTGGDAIGFRADIIDAMGIDLNNYKGLAGLGTLLREIKQANPDITPMMSGGSGGPTGGATLPFSFNFLKNAYRDPLGNQYLLAIIDPVNNQKVESLHMTENYRMLADYAYEWYQEGLIGYDEVSDAGELVKAGRSASAFSIYGPLMQAEIKANTGYDVKVWRPTTEPGIVFTNNVWTWSIAEASRYPERALEVLNEFYINADLANLLEWGIEGEHYVIVDADKGLVSLPEGKNPGNAAYFNFIKDNIPNCYLTFVGANEPPDKWELYQKHGENNMISSPYLGFTLNLDPVQNEFAACTNVVNKYYTGLMSGLLNPATEYPKFIEELNANGIQALIDEAQSQFDSWYAANVN